MNRIKRKRTLIALCSFAVFLFLVIGYAAYTEQLKLKANYNVTENFNVKITNIETTNLGGHAINAEAPTYTDTTATFNTKLYLPGDYAEYTVTVVNSGNIDAYLKTIEESVANDSAIKFKLTGITEGQSLKSESTMDFKVRIEYDVNVTEQPTDLNASYDLTLFYEQGEGTVDPGTDVPITPDPTPSGNYVYRWTTNMLNKGDSIDGIETTTDPTTLGKDYYLKHEIDSENKITASYACFVTDTEHCIRGGSADYYESNKEIILSQQSWFEANGGSCTVTDIQVSCNSNNFYRILAGPGNVNVMGNNNGAWSADCGVYNGDGSNCRN